ncbi:hypothetical protein AMECASPLE_030009 [Ameca splendens]|uniref:Uncharacterized protein n=1 Tax=Ameca splendens TaxID=208324 RepID=A0ABV1A2G4_9TELE
MTAGELRCWACKQTTADPRWAHRSAEVGEDEGLHGLHQVGGQSDWSVVGRFLGMHCFRNQNHTGGLPQDKDLLRTEAQCWCCRPSIWGRLAAWVWRGTL